ncbi:MAG: hypothetical protein ABL917_04260 [Parcubacteria group bacterium]
MVKVCYIFLLLCASTVHGRMIEHKKDLLRIPKTGQICEQFENVGNNAFPGVKNDEDPNFSRNQDTVGSCTAFPWVDMACKKLKDLGLWKYDDQCSVSDFELNIVKLRGHPNHDIKDFLEETPITNAEMYKYMFEIGFCPEKKFPSEFKANPKINLGNYRNHYESFSGKINTEANISLPGVCKECEEMAPTLSKANMELIIKAAKKPGIDKPDFEALKKMNELACPPEVRVKFPKNWKFEVPPGNVDINHVRNLLAEKEVFNVAIDVRVLKGKASELSRLDNKVVPHEVLVAGATVIDNRCFYVIKNSYGLNCAVGFDSKTGTNSYDTSERMCDPKSGAILISEELLLKSAGDLNYLTTTN